MTFGNLMCHYEKISLRQSQPHSHHHHCKKYYNGITMGPQGGPGHPLGPIPRGPGAPGRVGGGTTGELVIDPAQRQNLADPGAQ